MKMSNMKPISVNELDILKQLKVIRADNDIYQRMVQTYYDLLIANGDLKNMLSIYSLENKELITVNEDLQDQIDSVREDHDELDRNHVLLRRSIKNFIQDLKKIQENKEQGELFDVGL